VGAPADVCVFGPNEEWQLSAGTLKSRGKNTPYLGHRLSGRVRWTLVDGKPVYAADC